MAEKTKTETRTDKKKWIEIYINLEAEERMSETMQQWGKQIERQQREQ
jgi:hypothetical protein